METLNYSIFKSHISNRPVLKGHVNTIMKSILENGYFNSKPITVNNEFYVTDGQHRLAACRELGIPVKYEIDNVDANKSMIVLNSTSAIWRLDEYINHYASLGKVFYINLQKFIKDTKYGTSNCIRIYCPGIRGKQIRAGIECDVNVNLQKCIDLIDFLKKNLKFHLDAHLFQAITTYINQNVSEKNIVALKKNVFSFIECAQTTQYIHQLNKLSKFNPKN